MLSQLVAIDGSYALVRNIERFKLSFHMPPAVFSPVEIDNICLDMHCRTPSEVQFYGEAI
jgi:hypothetical protein